MKKNLQFWNPHRVILYFGGLLIISGLGYLYFSSKATPQAPKSKQKITEEIQKSYKNALKNITLIEETIKKSENLAKVNPTLGNFWLGKCYDLLHRELQQRQRLIKVYEQKALDPFYLENQQKSYKDYNLRTREFLKKWQFTEKSINYLEKAISHYDKAILANDTLATNMYVIQEHLQNGRLDKAQNLIEKTAQRPDIGDRKVLLNFFLADISSRKGNNSQKTLDLYETTLKEFSKLPPQRQMLYKENAGYSQMSVALLKDALNKTQIDESFREAAKLTPKNAMLFFHWAKFLAKNKKYALASTKITKALALNPEQSEFLYLQATIQAKQWKRLQSLQSLARALFSEKNNPDRPIYRKMQKDSAWNSYQGNGYFLFITNCGNTLPRNLQTRIITATQFALRNDFDKAIFLANKILEQDSQNLSANLIKLYCVLGQDNYRIRLEQDIALKQKMLAAKTLKPYIKAQFMRHIKTRKKELEAESLSSTNISNQIDQLQKNLEKAPEKQQITRVFCYFRWSTPEKTIELAKPLISSTKNNNLRAFALYMQGFSLHRLKKLEEALNLYKKAAQDASEIPSYQYLQAEIYEQQQQPNKAIDHYKKALQITNQIPEIHQKYASLLMKQGQQATAIEHLKKCVELAPLNYMAKYRLAKGYLLVKNQEEALKMLRNSFEIENSDTKKLFEMLRMDKEWQECNNNPVYEEIIADYQ